MLEVTDFSTLDTVTDVAWKTLSFGDYLSIKLGAVRGDAVSLSLLEDAFFDGEQQLRLAYP